MQRRELVDMVESHLMRREIESVVDEIFARTVHCPLIGGSGCRALRRQEEANKAAAKVAAQTGGAGAGASASAGSGDGTV